MINYRALAPHEVDAWAAHCQGVFGLDDTGYFKRHYEFDPDADPSLVFVAMDGDTIAATVRVFRREIWLRGRRVAMGGIGEVSTKPAYRRQGHAGRLLEMAIAAMDTRGMPVSILFGDQPLYERMGWRFRDIPISKTRTDALPSLPEDVSIRTFTPDDLPALMGMYDLYAGRLDGAIIRSEAYWTRWVLPQWTPPMVLEREGRAIAYCCMEESKTQERRAWAQEFAAAPDAAPLLGGFLRALAQARDCAEVTWQSALLTDAPETVAHKPSQMMVRLNSPVLDCDTSDALAALMENAGMFVIDGF